MAERKGRAFWPGFRWRILAHERTKANSSGVYTGKMYDCHAGKGYIPMTDGPTPIVYLDGIWEFDELCIDDWFHLEQMSDRDWWLGVGNGDDYWHVNIFIDRDGKASVQMEKQ